MQVGAVADRLLHAVRQVPESVERALYRHGNTRADTWLADDDIHVLRLQASQHRQLPSRRAFRVVNQNMTATRAAHREGRSRNDVVRVKAAFDYEPASGVPVQGPDVGLALGDFPGTETNASRASGRPIQRQRFACLATVPPATQDLDSLL